jgi:HEAT repeat protein
MAPEQIEGAAIDERVDLYAMGVILYELATGALPFRATTLGGILKAHLLEQPPRFEASRLAPGVPAELEAVVLKALAKEPQDRYASARELREDLARVLGGLPTRAHAFLLARAKAATPTPVTPNTPNTIIRSDPDSATLAGVDRSALLGDADATIVDSTAIDSMIKSATLADRTVLSAAAQTQPGATQPGATQPGATPSGSRSKLSWVLGGVAALGLGSIALVVRTGLKATPPASPPPTAAVDEKRPPKKAGPNVAELRSRALSVITAGLKDGDPSVRTQALDALAQGRDPRHATLAEPLLDDPDLQVRASAANTLGSLGARGSALALRRAVGTPPRLSLAAADALLRLGDATVARDLATSVKKGDDETRLRAALALGARDADARHFLDKTLSHLRPDDPRLVPVLARLAAVDAKARRKLVAQLDSAPPLTQVLAAESLARLGEERGKQRLTTLAAEQPAVSLLAYRALAALDDQSGFDAFRARFANPQAPLGERVLAAQGLGASGERSVLEPLGATLGDPEPALRVAAAGAILAVLGADPNAMAARSLDWATSALGDSSWLVRAQAVSVLADGNAAIAVPLLGKAIRDVQPEVRRAAASSLGRTKAPAAVPFLDGALEDATGDVRMTALRSLGKIGDKSAQPVLKKHFDRATPQEKVVAAGELVRLGDNSHVDDVKQALSSADPEVRKLAVEAAATAPALAENAAHAALEDKDFGVRFAAALQVAERKPAQANSGSPESKLAIPILQEGLKRGGSDGLAAWGALQALGVKPATPLNPETLFASPDVNVRLQAVGALAKLPSGDAIGLYRRALDDTDPRVRLAALEGLGDHRTLDAERRLALVKHLTSDGDLAIRAKAGALYAKWAPPPAPSPTDDLPELPQVPAALLGDLSVVPDLAHAGDLGASGDLGAAPDLAPAAASVAATPASPSAVALAAREEQNREEGHMAMMQGELALKAGRLDAAIRDLLRARKLNPKLPVYFALGEAHRKLGDRESDRARRRDAYTKAIEFYQKATDKRAAAYAAELSEQLKADVIPVLPSPAPKR